MSAHTCVRPCPERLNRGGQNTCFPGSFARKLNTGSTRRSKFSPTRISREVSLGNSTRVQPEGVSFRRHGFQFWPETIRVGPSSLFREEDLQRFVRARRRKMPSTRATKAARELARRAAEREARAPAVLLAKKKPSTNFAFDSRRRTIFRRARKDTRARNSVPKRRRRGSVMIERRHGRCVHHSSKE